MTCTRLDAFNRAEAGVGVAWKLGCLMISAAFWLAFSGCGGEDGTKIVIEITDPGADAVLTADDDVEPSIPGVQFHVTASSQGVSDATTVMLHIDGDQTAVTTPDESGVIEFRGVTLPPGEHEMYVRTASSSVQSAVQSYKLSILDITSPVDGQKLTVVDDDDASTPGIQLTVLVKAHGIDLGQDISLQVDDEEEDSATQDENREVTFAYVTFATGEHTLQAVAGEITSRQLSISVDDKCAGISFVQPAEPSGEDETQVVLGPGDDTDGTPCGSSYAITVKIVTDAPRGSIADLLVNDMSPRTETVGGQLVTFTNVVLPKRGDTPNKLTVHVDVDGVTCSQDFPVDLMVECDEDICGSGWHLEDGVCVRDENCTDNDPCGAEGTCVETGGVVSCECNRGYAGQYCTECAPGFHDTDAGDNVECELDTECMENSCGGLGECSDDDGFVVCDCDTGYTGDHCELCDDDADDPCGDHGECDDSTGEPLCVCDPGYADDTATDSPGPDCDVCAPGFHDEDGDCVLDETCLPTSCSYHGTCDASSGSVVCTCTGGFTSLSYCSSCSTGFHPSGNQCVLDETCTTNTCNQHGSCQVVNNETVCSCYEGWTGETCSECAAGFHLDTGECVLDQLCLDTSCAGHGECDASSDVVVCTCETGYTPESYCMNCDTGYHKSGGLCVQNEVCVVGGEDDSCNNHGTCDDSTGEIVCSCETGWYGDNCMGCAPGYHFYDDGSEWQCVVDISCVPTSCNYHGDCDDTQGYVICDCEDGYDPATYCATCAIGYHDEDPTPGVTCVENEVCVVGGEDDSCNNHGTCEDSTGVIVCTCDPGYTEASYCSSCDTGYSACSTECCSSSQVCYNDTCCTPLGCDDLPECGDSGSDDGCGSTIDCGDCGDHGSCVSNVCACDDNYGVLSGGHECVYACDGYLPGVGCCYEGWLVYCESSDLISVDCPILVPPYDVCGWSSAGSYFNCGGTDTVPGGESIDCPSNIVIDTTPPACTDDGYEDNDASDSTATPVTNGTDLFATKCMGDLDFFRIDLVAGETVTATINFNTATANLDLVLWYPVADPPAYNNLVLWADSGTNTETVTFTAGDEYPYYPGVFTGAGTYYIEVWEAGTASTGYELIVTTSGP